MSRIEFNIKVEDDTKVSTWVNTMTVENANKVQTEFIELINKFTEPRIEANLKVIRKDSVSELNIHIDKNSKLDDLIKQLEEVL